MDCFRVHYSSRGDNIINVNNARIGPPGKGPQCSGLERIEAIVDCGALLPISVDGYLLEILRPVCDGSLCNPVEHLRHQKSVIKNEGK